jgi:hypothetical protein
MHADNPEALSPEVCQELAFHQGVLEQLADKVYRMECKMGCLKSYGTNFGNGSSKNTIHVVRIDTKMPPIPDKVPTAPPRVVGEKSIPSSLDMPSVPGPLPDSLHMGVYAAYDKVSYGRFMVCVDRVQQGIMSVEDAYAEVFDILQYDGGTSHNGKISRDQMSKSRRPDLYRMFVEWSTSGPPVVVGKKKKTPFSSMLGPLPEALRMGVYEAYGYPGYGELMKCVVALQEGTMSLEKADDNVFRILGYEGGWTDRYHIMPQRDASSKSFRPDLYRMFVEWSNGVSPVVGKKKKKSVPFSFGVIGLPAAPPEPLCLDSLSSEVLVKDLIALEAALSMSMSPTMQRALRTGVSGPSVPFSCDAMRLLWQKELLKRVSVDIPHQNEI